MWILKSACSLTSPTHVCVCVCMWVCASMREWVRACVCVCMHVCVCVCVCMRVVWCGAWTKHKHLHIQSLCYNRSLGVRVPAQASGYHSADVLVEVGSGNCGPAGVQTAEQARSLSSPNSHAGQPGCSRDDQHAQFLAAQTNRSCYCILISFSVKCVCVCLDVCLSVCSQYTATILHGSISNFTRRLTDDCGTKQSIKLQLSLNVP